MAQSHPYGKAHSNSRGGREGTRSKANTRDSQALPIEQQLHLEYDFYGWRKGGWGWGGGGDKPKPTRLVKCVYFLVLNLRVEAGVLGQERLTRTARACMV